MVFADSELPHVFALTMFEDYIYWSDWELKAVVRAHKYHGTARIKVTTMIHRPMDLQVLHPMRQKPLNKQNPCENNGGDFHDQADVKWIVIRGLLRGQQYALRVANSRSAYWPPQGWPPLRRIWCFELPLIISNVIFNIVRLTLELTLRLLESMPIVAGRKEDLRLSRKLLPRYR
jgi:hypothetical protein